VTPPVPAGPFYLCDLDLVTRRFREFTEAFGCRFPRLAIGYSYKTNYLPALIRHLHGLGAFAEVVSAFEEWLARRIGVDGEHIIVNGPGKSRELLCDTFRNGSMLNLDSFREARTLAQESGTHPGTRGVGLRVNVTHPESRSGRERSRFGLPRSGPEGLGAATRVLADAGIPVVGLHAHLSTRSRSLEVFRGLVGELATAADELSLKLEYVDVGGGFGQAPEGMDLHFPTLDEYAGAIRGELESRLPGALDGRLVIEPGIAMVGDAFSFFAPVVDVREIDRRSIALVDGSIHNVKPTRHRHSLPAAALDARLTPKEGVRRTFDVAGYTCMDDDYLAQDLALPDLQPGDVIRFDGVGAYTLVFKPPFIRPTPPVYVLEHGQTRLARRAESFDDLVAGDV
jgi:diaminopimelate decarboxylase